MVQEAVLPQTMLTMIGESTFECCDFGTYLCFGGLILARFCHGGVGTFEYFWHLLLGQTG